MNKLFVAAAAALCGLSLCGCGGGAGSSQTTGIYTEITMQTADSAAGTVPCGDITGKILSAVEMPSMAEVGADRVKMYLDADIPEGADFSMFICGSGGFADEVFVINLAGVDAEGIRAAAEKRIEARKKDFESYNPDEFAKLSDYYCEEKGGYFIYAVTADNSVCESIFGECVK